MAMVSVTCPSCQATVKIDDEKEFGFCEQCGAKIMTHEAVAAKSDAPADSDTSGTPEQDLAHLDQQILESGVTEAIPVDYAVMDVPTAQPSGAVMSSDVSSLLVAANRAFDERNFADAYEKYGKVLASIPQSFEAMYRSAICSAYLASSGDPDVGSFEASMKSAMDALDSGQAVTSKSYVDASSAKDLDITNMLISMFSAGRASDTAQSCLDNCKKAYANWLKMVSFAYTAVSYIEKESFKETALASAIDFCDLIKNKEMTYLAGMETNAEGKSKQIYSAYTPDPELTSKFVKIRGELAETFNNLPSRVAKINDLKTNIQTISESVDTLRDQVRAKSSELNNASKSFWDAHPDQYKERSTMRMKSFIIFGVAAIIGVALYLLKQPTVYAVAVIIIGLLITLSKMRSDTKKYDEKVLSFDVKLIRSDLDTLNSKLSVEENALKEKQKALSDFEKTNK